MLIDLNDCRPLLCMFVVTRIYSGEVTTHSETLSEGVRNKGQSLQSAQEKLKSIDRDLRKKPSENEI